MKIHGIDKTTNIISTKLPVKNFGTKEKTGDFQRTFEAVLSNKTDLKFSGHAIDRLTDRGVRLDESTVSRLDKAVVAAGKKGSGQSLVLLDEMAFVVSIKNKTVITAMETDMMKEGVFTKIDSAVIG